MQFRTYGDYNAGSFAGRDVLSVWAVGDIGVIATATWGTDRARCPNKLVGTASATAGRLCVASRLQYRMC
jgi:hypothetical protein